MRRASLAALTLAGSAAASGTGSGAAAQQRVAFPPLPLPAIAAEPVSYTHLTLPTICSV